jgi:hypothetical protein
MPLDFIVLRVLEEDLDGHARYLRKHVVASELLLPVRLEGKIFPPIIHFATIFAIYSLLVKNKCLTEKVN